MASTRKRLSNSAYSSMKLASAYLERAEMNYAPTKAEIKAGMLKQFEEEIDKELEHMPHNCGLGVVFRFDRITKEGKVIAVNRSERCSEESNTWRLSVFERDNHKCVICGEIGKLQAHHIKGWAEFPKLRYDVDNGETLCLICHASKHPENANLILNSTLHRK